MNYFPNESESKQALLAPFRLLPEHDWSHGVYFYQPFSREDDMEYRNITSKLKTNIQSKRPLSPQHIPYDSAPHEYETDPQFLQPVMHFFNTHFIWNTGEYTGTITIHTEPTKATISKKFRFTLFDAESAELKNYSEDYKYGLGVYFFNTEKHPGLTIATNEI